MDSIRLQQLINNMHDATYLVVKRGLSCVFIKGNYSLKHCKAAHRRVFYNVGHHLRILDTLVTAVLSELEGTFTLK